MILLEAMALVAALSIDALTAGIAYGAQKITVPLRCVLVISLLCSGMLTLSLACGTWVARLLPQGTAHWICFIILFVMGICKLFDSVIKTYLRKNDRILVKFSAASLHVVLRIYADAQAADRDHSQSLSIGESGYLAVALSLDGMAVGFGMAASGFGILLPAALSLAMTVGAVKLGCLVGKSLAGTGGRDLSWLSGVLLIFLAMLKR